MSYLDTRLQYWPNNIKEVKPIGELTLYQWLYSIKNPKPEIMTLFKEIEVASSTGDLKRKASLKQGLYYLTPATWSDTKGRSYSNIQHFTQLAVVDVDGLQPEYAKEFKEYLFHTYPFFIATYLSPSKKGVKGLVRIPEVKSTDEFKEYYYGLLATLMDYKGVDPSPCNSVLAHYITYDTELLYRLNATVFEDKGIRADEFKISEEWYEPIKPEDVNPEDVAGIKNQIDRMLSKIDVDQTAHLTIRSLGLLIGGWISYGYFDQDEITRYVLELMEDVDYLSKSRGTYRKTFLQMVRLGMTSAIPYNND